MKSALLIFILVLSFTTTLGIKRKSMPGLSLCCLSKMCRKNEVCVDTGPFSCKCSEGRRKKKRKSG